MRLSRVCSPVKTSARRRRAKHRLDSEVQLAVVDRTPEPSHRRDANAWGILHLYDLEGNEIWQRRQEQGRVGDCHPAGQLVR